MNFSSIRSTRLSFCLVLQFELSSNLKANLSFLWLGFEIMHRYWILWHLCLTSMSDSFQTTPEICPLKILSKRKHEIKQIFDQFLEQKEENRRKSGFGMYNQPTPKLWEEHVLLEGTHVTKSISVLMYTETQKVPLHLEFYPKISPPKPISTVSS